MRGEGGGKSTIGRGNVNLRSIKVKKEGEEGFVLFGPKKKWKNKEINDL
jgi:hypothetical protein